jgi:homoserine O-succinyltransferase
MTIAFVNNMGPTGFEAVERQFRRLVGNAADDSPGQFRRFTLNCAPPLGADDGRLAFSYAGIEEIWDLRVDALVVTGAEPRCDDLRDEPYWDRLTELLDWAETRRIPVLLSCLAAHAAVLHWDGITRRRLREKRSGVYPQQIAIDHPLLAGITSPVVPHSRWNEIDAGALSDCGYQIVTHAEDGAVDTFVRRGRNLALCFQGHPEYDPETLLLEYRRDVRRYLTGVTTHYPDLPVGYFSPDEAKRLRAYRERCRLEPNATLIDDFPVPVSRPAYAASWQHHARLLCANWLDFVREHAG